MPGTGAALGLAEACGPRAPSASGEGPSRLRSRSGPLDPMAPGGLVSMGKDKLFCACPLPFLGERFLALPCQTKVCCICELFTLNPESVSVCLI